MNAETVRRSLKRLALFMAMLLNSMLSPSSSEGENENEYAFRPNNNTQTQTLLLMRRSFNVSFIQRDMTSSFGLHSNQNENGRNSHGHYSFYPQRPAPFVVIYNANIFNFSPESFSPTSIFAPLLPILLRFLQIRSSGTSRSPLELRPLAVVVFVGCSVAYYFTLTAKFMFPGFAPQLEALMSVFGSVAVATLISLNLHLPWWSIFFMLFFIGGLFKLLNKLHATYCKIRRPRPRTMRPHLPLYHVIFHNP